MALSLKTLFSPGPAGDGFMRRFRRPGETRD